MPRQILFIQGGGEGVHDQWDNKLVANLKHELGDDFTVFYPYMPDEADPSYLAWKPALLKELDGLDDGAILIGHSVGGTILLHVLADQDLKFTPGALMLIAPPFVGDGGWKSDDMTAPSDFTRHLPTGVPIVFYHGTDDETVPAAHIALYAKAIPQATIRLLPHRDHQLNNDLTEVARDIRAL